MTVCAQTFKVMLCMVYLQVVIQILVSFPFGDDMMQTQDPNILIPAHGTNRPEFPYYFFSNRENPISSLAVFFICFSSHAIEYNLLEGVCQGKLSPRPISYRVASTEISTDLFPHVVAKRFPHFHRPLFFKNIYDINTKRR